MAVLLPALITLTACTTRHTPAIAGEPSLQQAFAGRFLVGAALNERYFAGTDPRGAALVAAQFNSITPENVLKWELVHPEPERYDFQAGDQFVEFGEANEMFIVGHALVWHHQIPKWVFKDDTGQPLDREKLLQRMREHIHTVVGRYKGRIQAWDVVNEALEEDGSLRQSPWLRIIGEDYLEKAFQFAHEADPAAALYYNDYALENEPKRDGAIALVKRLQEAGVRIDGIGTQQHVDMEWPTAREVEETFVAFAQLGIPVMVTELDVDVLPRRTPNQTADVSLRRAADPALNPYPNGLPPEIQAALADRYAELFKVYLKHQDSLARVTFWGVTDRHSWLNGWPIPGRTNHPLLFDRKGQPKPAFGEVVNLPPH